MGDEKRKQGLELNKQIHLIVSANVWRDLWMNVVLLHCGGSTKSHSLQYTAQAGISPSPSPLGAFQSRSPQRWKIKTESLLHILWPDWCCSYHKGRNRPLLFIIPELWSATLLHSRLHLTPKEILCSNRLLFRFTVSHSWKSRHFRLILVRQTLG